MTRPNLIHFIALGREFRRCAELSDKAREKGDLVTAREWHLGASCALGELIELFRSTERQDDPLH